MNWFAATLWDLMGVKPQRTSIDDAGAERARLAARSALDRVGLQRGGEPTPLASLPKGEVKLSMQDRYDALVIEMKKQYGVRIRKWRSSTSGCAWEVRYSNGELSRLVESPYPRGPMSCAIFMHEIGHHAIGFGTYRLRCLEEYHAWRWALEQMRARNLNVTPAVEKRMHDALHYALAKAARRGIKRIPVELEPYLKPWGGGAAVAEVVRA